MNNMKRILISAVVVFTSIATTHAQSAQVRIKVKEAEIPVSVVESFKKDFGEGKTVEWTIVPATIVGEEYVISGYDNLDGEKPTSYAVILKGTNTKAEAVYDQNGKLKYSKEVIKDTALPVAIRNAVTDRYPGFALISDQETIKEGRSNFIHYRIIIEKGKEKKALAVNANGKILREKKVRT
jgi:hypothetical protein